MLSPFMCVALAVYFEARGEPIDGQIAVAQVVMNRVEDDHFPDAPCDVVFQGGERRYRCQFTFYCDGKPDTPRDSLAWKEAKRVANLVMIDGLYLPQLDGVMHYHGDYVNPSWARKMAVVCTIGKHVFVL